MKKITLIFLSFVIYFNSISLANAATVGGWSLGSPIAQGASSVYTGIKNITLNGADYVKKGTAKITPTATGVAKVLARGAAGYALSVAVEQLLGAVDWVLDPANNQIVYTKPSECNLNGCGTNATYIYSVPGLDGQFFATQESACAAYNIHDGNAWYGPVFAEGNRCRSAELNTVVALSRYNNPAYDPNATDENREKTIPLETVAQKVISNAESGDTNAQVATTAAAADIVAEAEKDNAKARPIAQQLEASSSTKPADEAAAAESNTATGTQTQNPTKPEATDLKLTFPIFCNWAPTVCEAAQTVISFPKTLTNWWETGKEKAEGWATSISESWTEAKEWASSETKSEEKDTEVETIDEPLPNIDTGIFQASGQCPPDFSYPFPLPMGGTYTVTYSYATACYWFSKLYYIVVSVAWVIAFRIVTNTNTGNSENG